MYEAASTLIDKWSSSLVFIRVCATSHPMSFCRCLAGAGKKIMYRYLS